MLLDPIEEHTTLAVLVVVLLGKDRITVSTKVNIGVV